MSMFKPAVKHESKLRLAIAGPSGSGKTYTGLTVATSLANGGKVAVVDTEHGSASKYADLFHFDALEISAPFHPDKFIAAIDMAQKAGYDVLVIDSLSHAWNGPGGVLELKEQFARQKGYNDYTAWGPAGDIQNNFVQAILSAKIHIIATMRSKMEYAVEEYEEQGRKKTRIRKVGMAPIQRNDTEYEFDIVLDMDIENYATVSKTRCPELTGKVINKPGVDLANTLRSWLSGEPMPEFKAQPTRQPVPTPPANGKPAPVAAAPDPSWDELTPYNAPSPRDIAIRDGKQFVPMMAKQEGVPEPDVRAIALVLGMSAISKKESERGKQWDTIVDYIYLTRNEKLPNDLALAVINDAITLEEARKQVQPEQPALIDADPATAYAE